MPSRRAYLCTLATVGLAGCAGVRSGDDSTDRSTTPGSPTEPAGVEIGDTSVAYSFRYVVNVDHNGVYTADGKQFVFVTVDDAGGSAHSLSAFSLLADGESYRPTTFRRGEPSAFDTSERAYRRDSEPFETGRAGWVCFVVPEQLDSTPTLHLDGDEGTWEWPLEGLDRATMPPPEWEWTVSTPETVAPASSFEIEFSATNVGDGPGRFRAAVNFSNLSYHPETVGISLDPAESGTATVSAESGEAGQLFTYGIRTAGGNTEAEVRIAADSTTATATTTSETD